MSPVVTCPVEPEEIRHVGQAVAVVVAEGRYAALDALRAAGAIPARQKAA